MNLTREEAIHAWHFTDGMKLRDGTPLVNGKEYVFDESERCIITCARGYHASKKLSDALGYAPGSTLSKVLCYGHVEETHDKLVCTHRIATVTHDIADLVINYGYEALKRMEPETYPLYRDDHAALRYVEQMIREKPGWYTPNRDKYRAIIASCGGLYFEPQNYYSVFQYFPNLFPWFKEQVEERFKDET